AASTGVIAVAATDLRREPAYYSQSYAQIDIAAPGGDATTDENLDGFSDAIVAAIGVLQGGSFQNGFGGLQGSSMATPHVAAGLALMRMIDPGLTPAEVDGLLANGQLTTDIGPAGKDNQTGYGLMSLPKMVQAAIDTAGGAAVTPPPPSIFVTPNRLDFGDVLNSITLQAEKTGTGALSVSSVTGTGTGLSGGGSWLSVNNSGADASGLGTYQFVLDRSSLGVGTFEANVSFNLSDATSVDVPVSVFNRDTNATGSSSAIFLIFEVKGNNEVFTEAVQTANANGLGNLIAQAGLEEGTYRVIFGTDMDNDGFICDQGELCGTYPPSSTNFEGEFEIDQNLVGLQFITESASPAGLSSFDGTPIPAQMPIAINKSKTAEQKSVAP
ncbi:MAG: S8 family serine peptidase, partial [Pseudomonadota bacterium]